MNQSVQNTLKNLSEKPGVYRFYTSENSLLYIGKAKNLKKRVSSYFQQSRHHHNQRLELMVSQIDRIEYTVVETEKEAIILEANLINSLQPRYNILLKDDRNYLYVRITSHEIPSIFLVRHKFDPQSTYFGPYTRRNGIFDTLRTLRTVFPYCQVRTKQDKPCDYYQLKQCDGICFGKESLENYLQKLEQIKKVLSGQTEQAEDFIKNQIQTAILKENFALAAMWRDRLKSLQETVVNQKIILQDNQDIDIITLAVQTQSGGLQIGSVFVQTIRSGKIINVNNFLLSGSEDGEDMNENELANSFLQRFFRSYYTQDENTNILLQTYILDDETSY